MNKFKEMNLVQLMKYFNEEWEKDEPELEDNTTSRLWENTVEEKIRTSSGLEILQALHEVKDIDYLEITVKMRDAFSEIFGYEYIEKLKRVIRSVKLLLKELENQQSSITIGQLNSIKGGI